MPIVKLNDHITIQLKIFVRFNELHQLDTMNMSCFPEWQKNKRCDYAHSIRWHICLFYRTKINGVQKVTHTHRHLKMGRICEKNFTCFTHLPQRFVVWLRWNCTQIVVCGVFLYGQIVCESTEKMPKNTKTKSNIEQNVRDRMMAIRKKELCKM